MLTLGNGNGEEIERQDCTVAFSSEQEISLDTRICGTEYRKVGKLNDTLKSLLPAASYGESTAFYPSGPGIVLLGVFLEPCSKLQGMIKFSRYILRNRLRRRISSNKRETITLTRSKIEPALR